MNSTFDEFNVYEFITKWRVEGTCGEVADILGDPVQLSHWWPSVYLDAQETAPADSRGVGRRVRLLTKGWLPYTLAWEFVVVESRYPHGFSIDATGDFVGRGIWTIVQGGPFVDIVYDWRIRAEKPLLRVLSPLLKPLFAANHRWAMAQGEISLKLELARRRATSDAAKRAIPPPPGPVTYAGVVLVAAAGAAAVAFGYAMFRRKRTRSVSRNRVAER
jgi:hypothetical protein